MSAKPSYFDYLTPARAAGLSEEQISVLVDRCRAEYGEDQNLMELRLLRTAHAIERGAVTFAQAMEDEATGLNRRGRAA